MGVASEIKANSAKLFSITDMSRNAMKPLFRGADIFALIEHQKQELKNTFKQMPDAELDADSEGVAKKVVDHFSLHVPTLDEASKYATTKEVQVDVSRDPRRFFSDRSRPHYVGGTEIRIIVPFHGDPGLFHVQPSMISLNPPFAEIHNSEVHLVYEVTDSTFDVEAAANRTIAEIKQHLNSIGPAAEQLTNDLKQLVASLIEGRKRERGTHAQIVAGLKIPVREAAPVEPPSPASPVGVENRSKLAKKREEHWDVFISHASEDKDAIAKPLADALRAKGLEVWYDDFALKLGDSLRQSIDRGLARSRFGVVILSARFFEKHWPQQELNGLATREVNGEKVILPVWHGVGFAEVSGYSPTLADRKAVHTDKGLPYVVEQIMEVVK